MTTENSIELLAPAGSVTALKAVIEAGADAVYIGGSRFGARAYAENPDESDLVSALDYAHRRGVRVYLTVNTLLKETELCELVDYIKPYYIHGVDAVLVQDFGVLKVLHENFPDMPLHASTQMTVTGPYSAAMLGEYGVTRVVPARELSLRELREIREFSNLEVEAFVHGAICVCYSGQCLLSGMIGGRSGNRGRCAQPCRLRYTLTENRGGKIAGRNKPFSGELLSPKDMCTLDFLPDLIEAGVCSFKIEGRMKQAEYGAGVVSIYRKYIDMYLKNGRKSYRVSQKDRKTLLTLFNRDGFTDGYLKRHNGAEMIALNRRTLSEQEEKARADLYEKMHSRYVEKDTRLTLDGKVTVRVKSPLSLKVTEMRTGECLTVYGEKVQQAESRPLTEQRIYDQVMKTGGSDYRFRDLTVDTDGESFVPMAQLNALRREAFEAMNDALLAGHIRSVRASSDRNMSADRIENSGPATSGTFYRKHTVSADYTGNSSEDPQTEEVRNTVSGTERFIRISAEVQTEEQFRAVLSSDDVDLIYVPYGFFCNTDADDGQLFAKAESLLKDARARGKKLSLAMPYIERNDGIAQIRMIDRQIAEIGYEGFLARSFETLARLRKEGLEKLTRADSSVYTFNSEAREFLESFGFDKDTVPVELNKKEILNRRNDSSEFIVYGHLPLMITAQCLKKTTSGCTHDHPSLSLTDRKGRTFKVTCDCDFCYNIIRNPVVLSLFGEADFMKRTGIRQVRLIFTDENTNDVSEICRIAGRAIHAGSREDVPGEHTKGHFNRGVE